jgi:hypothetical protein
MRGFRTIAAGAACVVVMCGAANAEDAAPAGAPPSWANLIHCAKLADDEGQLACFKAAMKAAGYAPNPQEVTAERHQRFGLSAPQLGFLKHKSQAEGAQAGAGAGAAVAQPAAEAAPSPVTEPPTAKLAEAAPPPPGVKAAPEDENHVFVTIERVAIMPPLNRLLMVTSDGGVWEQSDNETVAPMPKGGQSLEIRKNMFGGYLCIFDKHQGVRCARVR